MELEGFRVKGVRADMVKNVVTLTFEGHLDAQMLDAKRRLALLAVDESAINLTIQEQQLSLPWAPSAEGKLGGQHEDSA